MGLQFPVFQIAPPPMFCGDAFVPGACGDGAELGIPPFVLTMPRRGADTVLQVADKRLGKHVSDAVVVEGEALTGNRMLEGYMGVLRRFRADQRADSLRATAGEVDFTGTTPVDDATDTCRYYTLYFDGGGRPISVRCMNPLVPPTRAEHGVVSLGSAVSCGGQVMNIAELLEVIMGLHESPQRERVLTGVEEAALSLETGACILADDGGRNRTADIPTAFFDALWCYLSAVRGGERPAVTDRRYRAFADTLGLLPQDLFGESYS